MRKRLYIEGDSCGLSRFYPMDCANLSNVVYNSNGTITPEFFRDLNNNRAVWLDDIRNGTANTAVLEIAEDDAEWFRTQESEGNRIVLKALNAKTAEYFGNVRLNGYGLNQVVQNIGGETVKVLTFPVLFEYLKEFALGAEPTYQDAEIIICSNCCNDPIYVRFGFEYSYNLIDWFNIDLPPEFVIAQLYCGGQGAWYFASAAPGPTTSRLYWTQNILSGEWEAFDVPIGVAVSGNETIQHHTQGTVEWMSIYDPDTDVLVILKSINGGRSWEIITQPEPHDGIFKVSPGGFAYLYTDGGESVITLWTQTHQNGDNYSYTLDHVAADFALDVDVGNNGKLIVTTVTQDGIVYRGCLCPTCCVVGTPELTMTELYNYCIWFNGSEDDNMSLVTDVNGRVIWFGKTFNGIYRLFESHTGKVIDIMPSIGQDMSNTTTLQYDGDKLYLFN